ncbi:MAG TPA: LacI family DNA-binding transcriptional regulator, partial [Mesorhizobium sp.]
MANDGGPAKRTTIYDLAQLAGTSASAVSSVLNGKWKQRRISTQLAERIERLAKEQGYALNMQASLLRREESHLIGMIVPKYDNRYFGSIVELFEDMARSRGLFPIVTCTRRDPELELEAARAMISHQVGWLIATGATNPDRISEVCMAAGVRSLNLDLPGSLAPSIISDNYSGARELTRRLLHNGRLKYGALTPLIFVGGRASDHNTAERLRGFHDAHLELGIVLPAENVLTCGYAAEKADRALSELMTDTATPPRGMFVNSTISLEGVLSWLRRCRLDRPYEPVLGCFDWDPLVALLDENIEMVRQDVPRMVQAAFNIIEHGPSAEAIIQVPTKLVGGAGKAEPHDQALS